jgi:hypothetical protein
MHQADIEAHSVRQALPVDFEGCLLPPAEAR